MYCYVYVILLMFDVSRFRHMLLDCLFVFCFSYLLFLFVLLIQYFSVNMIIIFVNFDKLITNTFLIGFFSILSKQTYSVYLFHFVIIYLISLNSFLLNNEFIFIFYLIFLFLFSIFFYYIFEKNIMENRPAYKDKDISQRGPQ